MLRLILDKTNDQWGNIRTEQGEEMTGEEYNRRQSEAKQELRRRNLLRPAQNWISKNMPPDDFKGTPLEWALLEMPTSAFLRWLGL